MLVYDNMGFYLYLFAYIESFLHPWNKLYVVLLYNLFYDFLGVGRIHLVFNDSPNRLTAQVGTHMRGEIPVET